jgi:hypothetical protein
MPRTERFLERIGAVFLPEADAVEVVEDFTPAPQAAPPGPGLPSPGAGPGLPGEVVGPVGPVLASKSCSTSLRQGCYKLSLRPQGPTRYRGTLRIEQTASGLRFSGDLYRYQEIDDIFTDPLQALRELRASDEDDDDEDGEIPIYRRPDYHSYLRGTGAQLVSIVPKGSRCTFTLEFEEFVYNHPATGFSGSFNPTATRSVRFELVHTSTSDRYRGTAYTGTTKLGRVSLRWIAPFYRRADLRVNTLQGAAAPPANVGGATFATILTDAGWRVSVTDGGTINLPAALAGVNINDCWSSGNLHTLMASVPGYNPANLDSVWRVHLVAVPAQLVAFPNNCGRGVMFDSSIGADPNALPREGAATFSHDGYPSAEVPDGMGGSHYDAVANQQQRNVPRAYLRSATHEVGHAFNQIHQQFEGGIDNSIMSPTPSVATVLGTAGTFPDQINLAFNDRVKKHLRHFPDPAVRPGAMDFFGSAIAAPEPADVAWLDMLDLSVTPSSDRVALGEPITLAWTLTNRGQAAVPAPAELDVESLVARVAVTDPTGRITFMRPAEIHSCPRISIEPLEPGATVSGSTTVFWGRDGFAFETPGRHVVEVIVLWELAGVPVAVSGERDVFVTYPTSNEENEVAAVLLDPDVGKAVAVGNVEAFPRAAERISQAEAIARTHPANEALRGLGLGQQPG